MKYVLRIRFVVFDKSHSHKKDMCARIFLHSTEPAVRISNPFRFMSALSLGVPSNLSHQPCCEPLALFFANQALFFSFHSRKYCVIWTEDCDSRVETQYHFGESIKPIVAF